LESCKSERKTQHCEERKREEMKIFMEGDWGEETIKQAAKLNTIQFLKVRKYNNMISRI
jgi:hypothetical protein